MSFRWIIFIGSSLWLTIVVFVFVFSHLAKKYYFLTNEWPVFDHVTALGQSSETISTLGSVSSYPAQIVTRTSCNFYQGQDAGH